MKSAICLLVFSLTYGFSIAQSVATINGRSISSKELIWAYKKSHNGNPGTNYDSLKNYLDLYLNFKLKALDAKSLGMDRNSSYADEVKAFEQALISRKKVAKNSRVHDFLVNEYKEGVLVFNLSEQKIWTRAQEDEQGLIDFYKENQTKYSQPLDEIKGEVIADYQRNLEENWLKSLKQKYQVKINEHELRKLASP